MAQYLSKEPRLALKKMLADYHASNKPKEVEGFWDKILIRPTGFIIAYLLKNSKITPNWLSSLTLLASFGAGISFYQRTVVSWFLGLGFMILISALDSADGQLARLKKITSTYGAVVDGLCDNLSFAIIYVFFYASYILRGGTHPWLVLLLGAFAGLSHSIQSAVVDFERKLFVFYIYGKRTQELDFPIQLKKLFSSSQNLFQRFLSRLLLNYNYESRFFLQSSNRLQHYYESYLAGDSTWTNKFANECKNHMKKILPWWTLMASNSHKMGIIFCSLGATLNHKWDLTLYFKYDILLNVALLFLILWQRKIDLHLIKYLKLIMDQTITPSKKMLKYTVREIMNTHREILSLDPENKLPPIDVTFVACRSTSPRGKGYAFDIINFREKTLERWFVPFIYIEGAEEVIKKDIYPDTLPMRYEDYHQYYIDQYMTPHIAQLSPQGLLFVSFGVAESGFASLILNTHTGATRLIKPDTGYRLHTQGGDFDDAHTKWYFTCWPPTNLKRHERGNKPASFEIRSINLKTGKEDVVQTIQDRVSQKTGLVEDPIPKRHHHFSVSRDSHYGVATSFDFDPIVPYPNCRPEEDPEGFRKTHEGGMRLEKLLTVDLKTGKYWQTEIPVPATGHVEFDLDESNIIYASAHNISPITQGTVLEGPATLYKLRIGEGRTEIIASYTSEKFYRITQHSVFRYRGKTLLAVTVTPNKMIIIDASNMTLWRQVVLFKAPEIVLNEHGVLDPNYPKGAYSLNPSKDGRYIVLENSKSFFVYDMDHDLILENTLDRLMPEGYIGEGHTRIMGE